MKRAPAPLRAEIHGCDAQVFDAEMLFFLMAAMMVGSDDLPDETMALVSPRLDELWFAGVGDDAERERLIDHIKSRLLFYDRMRDPQMFDTVIEFAANNMVPPSWSSAHAGERAALRTWLRALAHQVTNAQRSMIRSTMKRHTIVGD